MDIYGSRKGTFRVSGWSILIEHAQQKPLLPNLRSFILRTPEGKFYDGPYAQEQPLWVIAFASASLVKLSIPPGRIYEAPAISYRAASTVLKAVMQHRPNLEEVSLFPTTKRGNHLDGMESNIVIPASGQPFHRYLIGADNLRHLSGSVAWLMPEPQLVLSKLPQLESIAIYSCLIDPENYKRSVLPAQSFPALRRFAMHQVDPKHIIEVLWTRNMLQHVTSLNIDLDIDMLQEGQGDEEWAIHTLFPALVNIPHLCDLTIDIGDCPPWPRTIINPSVLNILSTLPLQSVTLAGMQCPLDSWPDNFMTAWPLVTKLSLPDQGVTVDQLSHFAALPKLEYLQVRLALRRPSTTVCSLSSRAPLHTLESSTKFIDKDPSAVDDIARLLLSYWPNLAQVAWPDPEIQNTAEYDFNRKFFEILNHRLNTLRALNDTEE